MTTEEIQAIQAARTGLWSYERTTVTYAHFKQYLMKVFLSRGMSLPSDADIRTQLRFDASGHVEC